MNGLDDTADEWFPELTPEPAPRGIPHVPVITPEERAASAKAEQAEFDLIRDAPESASMTHPEWIFDLVH